VNQPAPDPHEINAKMIARIGGMPLQPYREGGYALRVLEVTGRRTGQPHQVPMAVTQVGGQRYLTAPNRDRQWVKNILAAGECRLVGDGPARAVLVEGDEAAGVIKTYLTVLDMPFATAAFPVDPGESVERIAEHTGHTAVFRLEQDGAR
jgi:deazaflavin-dependent oxidoreductase (nitroreductase family)